MYAVLTLQPPSADANSIAIGLSGLRNRFAHAHAVCVLTTVNPMQTMEIENTCKQMGHKTAPKNGKLRNNCC